MTFGQVSLKDSDLTAKLVVNGLKHPTSMIFVDKDKLLVLEKNGLVKQVQGYEILRQPALDVTSIVNNTRERGLLGIVKIDDSTFSNESSGGSAKVFLY
ncbi:MAG TPA: hypothetical protein VJS91_08750, partial [Nitrososphaeraceae archaeon]|nr:hypothetical protein [Nitrososphaeraceae archaeon]